MAKNVNEKVFNNLIEIERIISHFDSPDTKIFASDNEVDKETIKSIVVINVKSIPEEFNNVDTKEWNKIFHKYSAYEKPSDDKMKVSEDQIKRIIARKLKLNIPNDNDILSSNFVICPVFAGMDGLYPLVFDKEDKAVKLELFSDAVIKFTEKEKALFSEENKADWLYSPIGYLKNIVEKHNTSMRILKVILRSTQDEISRLIKHIHKSVLKAERDKNSAGNDLINMVEEEMGTSNYRNLKIDMGLEQGNITKEEYDTLDKNTLLKFCDYPRTLNGKRYNKVSVLDRLLKDFDDITKEVKEEGKAVTKTNFKKFAKKFVNDYNLYILIDTIYNKYIEIYENLKKIQSTYVSQHPMWTNYLAHIAGFGEGSAAILISYFDFAKADHPSGFMSYVGLDQVTIMNETKNEQNYSMAFSCIKDQFCAINDRTTDYDSDYVMCNFGQFKTDLISTYDSYCVVREYFCKYETLDEASEDPQFMEVLNEASRYNYQELINEAGEKYYIIKKEARTKQEKHNKLSTYITKNGNISVKNGLGYNSYAKGQIMGKIVMTALGYCSDDPNSTKFSYYKKVMNDYYKRVMNRPDFATIEAFRRTHPNAPKTDKANEMIAHKMAIRFTAQRIVEDYWFAGREYYGMPLNGGTYQEAKLGIYHNNGISRPRLMKSE